VWPKEYSQLPGSLFKDSKTKRAILIAQGQSRNWFSNKNMKSGVHKGQNFMDGNE
jgi:hypothetical protein